MSRTLKSNLVNGLLVATLFVGMVAGSAYVSSSYAHPSKKLARQRAPIGTDSRVHASDISDEFQGKVVVSSAAADGKYHRPECRYLDVILGTNAAPYESVQAARKEGYTPCGVCFPRR